MSSEGGLGRASPEGTRVSHPQRPHPSTRATHVQQSSALLALALLLLVLLFVRGLFRALLATNPTAVCCARAQLPFPRFNGPRAERPGCRAGGLLGLEVWI